MADQHEDLRGPEDRFVPVCGHPLEAALHAAEQRAAELVREALQSHARPDCTHVLEESEVIGEGACVAEQEALTCWEVIELRVHEVHVGSVCSEARHHLLPAACH